MLKALLITAISCFVEVIHVELPNETGKVIVLEVFGQNLIRELVDILHNETIAVFVPGDYVICDSVTDNFVCFWQK